MNYKLLIALAGSALACIALAGCSPQAGQITETSPPSPSAAESPEAGAVDLTTASSDLGEIVVDGSGMTAYYFDKDTADSETSACTGQCEQMWPAITTTAEVPIVEGVDGTVGTITGVAGGKQITINGLPIYTFVDDTAAGDTNGQGVGGVWWAVAPNGDKISEPAAGY